MRWNNREDTNDPFFIHSKTHKIILMMIREYETFFYKKKQEEKQNIQNNDDEIANLFFDEV